MGRGSGGGHGVHVRGRVWGLGFVVYALARTDMGLQALGFRLWGF